MEKNTKVLIVMEGRYINGIISTNPIEVALVDLDHNDVEYYIPGSDGIFKNDIFKDGEAHSLFENSSTFIREFSRPSSFSLLKIAKQLKNFKF